MKRFNPRLTLALLAGSTFACGAAPTDEDLAEAEMLGEVSQPIWETTCNNYLDDTQSFHFDGTHAAGYGHGSNCNKTFIQEVTNFQKTHLVNVVVWDMAVPNNKNDCEAAWGAAQLFKKNGSSWTKLTSDTDSNYRKYGTWNPPSGPLLGYCAHSIAFPASLFTQGATHRIHATMRTTRQGATKAFAFENRYQPE